MKRISAGSVEDTLLLLDIVKEKQQVENRKLKVRLSVVLIFLSRQSSHYKL